MLYTAIVVAALGATNTLAQQQPLFPKLFPAPTGQNALEYYVKANDLANQYGQSLATSYDAEVTGLKLLDLQRQRSNRSLEVLALVQRGNRFPLVVPTSADPLPILAALKNLAKTITQLARVQFSEGDTNEAVESLLTVLELSDKHRASDTYLSLFLAKAIDSIVLAVFHDNYMAISLPAAQQVLKRVTVPETGQIVASWNAEVAAMDQVIRNPQADGLERLSAYLSDKDQKLDFASLQRDWAAAMQTGQATLSSILSQPESTWTRQKSRLSPDKLTSDPVTGSMLKLLGPEHLIEILVLWREQRRLLRVHAHIAIARWQDSKLPDSLSGLPDEARTDPLTGGPYSYVRQAATYDLFSPANNWFGDIRLKNYSTNMPRISGSN